MGDALRPTAAATAGAGGPWCDRCGEATGSGAHQGCAAARALEPPRYCAHCRRRMKVQVLPVGWSATCVEHGQARG
ncbi:hypothetical protein [Micromonospora endophytica]|uniref:Biotin synthase auxiliary protein n=1 Tax=Micromonospora endophytica TaxID=515350 RepID=A0A2W2C1F8_9ACTN|nr:hypothetical protein [Micromonospora endophytica]PZF93321.1 hypothetical protein C1I93_18095 [Micromonospora endophytica]RIW42467.1 hypothetical protein D3H59_23160 [Micromonospora endophytica]